MAFGDKLRQAVLCTACFAFAMLVGVLPPLVIGLSLLILFQTAPLRALVWDLNRKNS